MVFCPCLKPEFRILINGKNLPHILTDIPGPISIASIDRLSKSECPAITARRQRREETTGVNQDPIVWKSALGANIEDMDGNIYVDLTSGFGVASLGHRPPAVINAVNKQSNSLIHAMGDVYPSLSKIEFSEAIATISPGNLEFSILGLNGSDAVAAALKTAVMKTGNSHVISFENSYHGLFYGPLAISGYRHSFRAPFMEQLNPNVSKVTFPKNEIEIQKTMHALDKIQRQKPAGALIIEPILGRGGEHVAPPGFLAELRLWTQKHDIVLIFDEIWTGLGRTGAWFACNHENVVPDLLCMGKSLGGGFPLSAVIGTEEVMSSWGRSKGEAIHTATFLGHPISCAAGIAAIQELREKDWPNKIQKKGKMLEARLQQTIDLSGGKLSLRGRGYLQGLVFPDGAQVMELMNTLRKKGFLVLPSGPNAEVLAITPPFVISEKQLDAFFKALNSIVLKLRA